MDHFSITLDQFRAVMLAAGYDEVSAKHWAAHADVARHSHPFEANALLVAGEMWLTIEGQPTRKLVPGDTFHLAPNVPHEERYGASGAVYWVARRMVN